MWENEWGQRRITMLKLYWERGSEETHALSSPREPSEQQLGLLSLPYYVFFSFSLSLSLSLDLVAENFFALVFSFVSGLCLLTLLACCMP